jgi:hypothetical protein
LPKTREARAGNFKEYNEFDHDLCRAHIPYWNNKIYPDIAAFLSYFLPKGTPLNRETAKKTASILHLAFKGMDSDEIHSILMSHFLEAVAKYDPDYTTKVRLVVERINELSKSKQIHSVELDRQLDFECDRYWRLLARRGFLQAIKNEKTGRICGWERSTSWPPAPEFFQSGAIGLAYYVQTWFRYYLQQWIEKRLSELEAKEETYSCDSKS